MTGSVHFNPILDRYAILRVAVVGDFCLDRYLEIDPARAEKSIETGRVVHNIVRVRAQPGGAGTILNNLVALGVQTIHAVGFAGEDGEGYELVKSLRAVPQVCMDGFVVTPERKTFTYCKPLLMEPGQPPVELDRLDTKNWTPTPSAVRGRLCESIRKLADHVDAVIVLDQVDVADTGVVNGDVLETIGQVARQYPDLTIIADSRQGLKRFPSVLFKMNAAEFAVLTGQLVPQDLHALSSQVADFAKRHGQRIFVTLAEKGMLGASPDGRTEHVPSFPLRGPIDIVGAGDSVTANLACALAAGADMRAGLQLASAAASVVIHKLGTTGTASISELLEVLSYST